MGSNIWDTWHLADSPRFPHEKLIQFVYREYGPDGGHGKQALDLGCGSGANACFLAAEGFSVLGVDASSQAIRNLDEKAEARDLRIETHVEDFTNLSVSKGSLDLVVSIGVLEFASREAVAAAVPTAYEALRPGGRALLIFAADEDFRHEAASDLGIRKIDRQGVGDILSSTNSTNFAIDQYITTYENDTFRQVDWLVSLHKPN